MFKSHGDPEAQTRYGSPLINYNNKNIYVYACTEATKQNKKRLSKKKKPHTGPTSHRDVRIHIETHTGPTSHRDVRIYIETHTVPTS